MSNTVEHTSIIRKLESLLEEALDKVPLIDNELFASKPSELKWSKKEILGHLMDSAQINLQRIKDVLSTPESDFYEVKPYDQQQLVIQNRYQSFNTSDLFANWVHVNCEIVKLAKGLSRFDLQRGIVLISGEKETLSFLIKEYVDHTEHHLRQILGDH